MTIIAHISEFDYHFTDIGYMEHLLDIIWYNYGKWFPIVLEFKRG